MNNQSQSACSIPFLLTAVFAVMRITGAIDWSWLWITSPIWITWGIGLALIGVGTMLSRQKRA